MDTFPLFVLSNAYREKHKLLSCGFPEKSAGYLLVRRLFPFFGIILLMGRCDLVYDDPRPCGDPDSLQSKRSLGGLIFGPCKSFVSIPRCFVIGEALSSNLLPPHYPSPESLKCLSVFVSDFNFIPPVKPILLSRAIYTGHG